MRAEWRQSWVGWLGVVVALLIPLGACQRKSRDASEPPVAITDEDTSVTDGMFITRYPGPRGEAYLVGTADPVKFGSTKDVFTYVRQPDVAHRLGALYVQDTARIDWEHPSNAASSFIDARRAYYVAWQSRLGMMGPTFAPFRERADAEAFAHRYGGAVLTYDEITASLAERLTAACPAAGSSLAGIAERAGCVSQTSADGRASPGRSGSSEAPAAMAE